MSLDYHIDNHNFAAAAETTTMAADAANKFPALFLTTEH